MELQTEYSSSSFRKKRDNDETFVSAMILKNSSIKMCCRKLNFPCVGNCSENDSSVSYKSHRRRNNMTVFSALVLSICTVVLVYVTSVTAEFSVRSVGKSKSKYIYEMKCI